MRAWEANSSWLGIPTRLLMENAGRSVASVIDERIAGGARVAVVAGVGGKAGDGFVAARHLAGLGYDVTVYLVRRSSDVVHPDARANLDALLHSGVEVVEEYATWSGEVARGAYDVVIDALIGTGIRGGEVRRPMRDAIVEINEARAALKVAIDVPSGLNPDTGEVAGVAVRADITVTMHCVKRGLVAPEAREYVGEIVVAPIGIPPAAELVVGPGDVEARVPGWKPRGHKGVHGRVLVVAGSREYPGAAWLAAYSALEAGADLVYLAAPEPVLETLVTPQVIPIRLEGDRLLPSHVPSLLERARGVHSVLLGPGLGLSDETREAVERLVVGLAEARLKLVLDADGLKLWGARSLPEGVDAVATPHLGEASRLLGASVEDTLESRVKAAKQLASKLNAVVLLKGWVDVIASPAGGLRLNYTGTPQMTVGGTGDVLAGVTAALQAKGASSFDAASAAAYAVGAAGEACEESRGRVTPLCVAEKLGEVLSLRFTPKPRRFKLPRQSKA